MAEEEQSGGQNVWLLLIALGLGLVVVIIYNVHILKVREEGRGEAVQLIRVTRDLDQGEKIAEEDLVVKLVPKQHQVSLGKVVPGENLSYVVGETLNSPINKGRWLTWAHITGDSSAKPSDQVGRGKVLKTIPLDEKKSLGDLLRQNNAVNLVGHVWMDKSLRTVRIIEGVKVVAIGGLGAKTERGAPTAAGGNSRTGMRSYRDVTVELSPKVAIELDNVLTYVNGGCWLELIGTSSSTTGYGVINPELKKLAAAPTVSRRGATFAVPTGVPDVGAGSGVDYE